MARDNSKRYASTRRPSRRRLPAGLLIGAGVLLLVLPSNDPAQPDRTLKVLSNWVP
jgi:hypothetical protein